MKHWILLFTPETYEAAKKLDTIGVRSNVWKSFSETSKKDFDWLKKQIKA